MTRILKADRRGGAHLPAELVDAHAQARSIVEAAHARAEAIEREARERGEAAGRRAAAAELAAAHLAHARDRERALAALEPQAVEVALRAARTLVGQELATRPEAFRALVARLLRQVRGARVVELRVHADDRTALLEALGEQPPGLAVVVDAELARGDCVVQSDIGRVDGRLDLRVEALARALEDG